MTSEGSQESGSQPQASDPDRQVEIVADMLDLIWKRQAESGRTFGGDRGAVFQHEDLSGERNRRVRDRLRRSSGSGLASADQVLVLARIAKSRAESGRSLPATSTTSFMNWLSPRPMCRMFFALLLNANLLREESSGEHGC